MDERLIPSEPRDPTDVIEVRCRPLNPHASPDRFEAHQRRVLDSTGMPYRIRREPNPEGPPDVVLSLQRRTLVAWSQRVDCYSHSYEPS
jgi:G:T-mismatch repair DNA endonuclease (very short patch repair protein)